MHLRPPAARRRGPSLLAHALVAALLALAVAGCATSAPGGPGNTPAATSTASHQAKTVHVVAAENIWGSIAAQLGGPDVRVTNIIDNPNADPHDYEATAKDVRGIAEADLVIVNGAGYDPWASKAVAANPNPRQTVLNVGDLVGVKPGGNPHLWYSPTYVARVVKQITADLKKLDPSHAAAFTAREDAFTTTALAGYHHQIADIKAKYAGTPVGASESVFVYLARALGLKLITPPSFLNAISEGSDVSAKDKSTIDEQIGNRKIKVYVYNSQNSTPDVKAQVDEAKRHRIPVTVVTETLTPAGASFQQWQVAQLKALAAALATGTAR